jgi:hypothetical protein
MRYFQEIGKLCCKKEPMVNKLDMMSPMPNSSVYAGDYVPKPLAKEPAPYNFNKWPGYVSDVHQPIDSEYISEYPGKMSRPVEPFKPEVFIEEKPMIGMSHYKHNFPKWMASPAELCKPLRIPSTIEGLSLAKDSLYKRDFGPKEFSPSPNFGKQPRSPPHQFVAGFIL